MDNTLSFGGSCDPSRKLENAADPTAYEEEFFSIKDKQGIMGRVQNLRTYENIKDIEVMLEGNRQKLVTKTDESGLYYFLFRPTIIKLPSLVMQQDSLIHILYAMKL